MVTRFSTGRPRPARPDGRLSLERLEQRLLLSGSLDRASASDFGDPGDADSGAPSLSGGGRYVAFQSEATNLIPEDTNGLADVFIYDRRTYTVERISVGPDDAEADGASGEPDLSSSGRYTAFSSVATNLVAGDANGASDVFVFDWLTGAVERVSVADDGTEANGASGAPSISDDARYVAFSSGADNLVPGDTNGVSDIFLYDRTTDTVRRVSVAADGTQGNGPSTSPVLSGDGLVLAFCSEATNLVAGDANGVADVFVCDMASGAVERVSVSALDHEANGASRGPALSSYGRYVSFVSDASNLVSGDTNGASDVFLFDRQVDAIQRVSVSSAGAQSNGAATHGFVEPEGRYVAFSSTGMNLVAGDTNGEEDVFVHDCLTGRTVRVSVTYDGGQGNGASTCPVIGGTGGRFVAFVSDAFDPAGGGPAGHDDVFARDGWWVASTTYADGVSVTLYDADPYDGVDVPAANIAWSPAQYRRGSTSVMVNPGRIGDGVIAGIYLFDGKGATDDLGIVVAGEGSSLIGLVDARRNARTIGFVAVQGDVRAVTLRSAISGARLDGFVAGGGWILPSDVDGAGGSDDLTALYCGGTLTSFVALGNVGGDVVAAKRIGLAYAVGGNLSGDVAATGGPVDRVICKAGRGGGGTISGDIRASGAIGLVVTVNGNISGDIAAGGRLGVVKAAGGGLLGPTITAAEIGVLVASGGNITADITSRGALAAVVTTRNLTGDISAAGRLAKIVVSGNMNGNTITTTTGKGDLLALVVLGDVTGSAADVSGLLNVAYARGQMTNSRIAAGRLAKVVVGGQISTTGADEIHASTGRFFAMDRDDRAWVSEGDPHTFGGVQAYVG